MAPKTIKDDAPNTLPADFDEWEDGGGPPATLPDDFFDSIDAPAAPPTKVATPQPVAAAPVLPKVVEPPAAATTSKVPAKSLPSKPPKSPAPPKPQAAYTETRSVPVPIKPKQPTVEPEEESEGKSKLPVKWIAIGAALIVLILAGILIPRMFTKPTATTVAVNQPVPAQPTATSPVAATSSAQTKPTALTPKQQQQQQQQQQQGAASQPVQQQKSVDPGGMIDQLVAPSRIAQNIKSPEKESGPSQNFSASGMEGLGGASGTAVGSVMGGSAHPKVSFAAPKNVSISSGVASGLLLQRRDPVYPSLAKQANVSGTVVLEATISKSGAIQNLHVLSGPIMLRQAALDAVGSWRYKPYMLDSQPVDVQTTINVTFALGR
jgi:TonB family protein